MIKSIEKISALSSIDRNRKNNIHSLSSIAFQDEERGSGAFASVHEVVSIDGNPVNGILIKILFEEVDDIEHNYETIKYLHQKLSKRQVSSGLPPEHEVQQFSGVPFAMFRGFEIIEGKNVVAFLMNDLSFFGYHDFGSDDFDRQTFQSVDFRDKIYLAYCLANSFSVLHEMYFMHSDISENALWINFKNVSLAIIDYDSGYHIDLQSNPSTFGKIGHWMSALKDKLLRSQDENKGILSNRQNLEDEYWVIANAVFELIAGVMPFFYLAKGDNEYKGKYLQDFTWPAVDTNSDYFNSVNSEQYSAMLVVLNFLEENGVDALVESFRKVFNEGFKKERKRLSSAEWRGLLFEICAAIDLKPEILAFESSKLEIYSREDIVEFSWSIKRASRIFLDGELVDFGTDSFSKCLEDSKEIQLKVENDFGTVTRIIEIEAIKKDPEQNYCRSDLTERTSLDPVLLEWSYENCKEVKIVGVDGVFLATDKLEVEPKIDCNYEINAIGFFGQEVKDIISIKVVKPSILNFDFDVNLEYGFKNVDVIWKTENTTKVTIIPKIGESELNGVAHVKLDSATEFKIIAEGLFGKVEEDIVAHPFPLPVIRQISSPSIAINIDSKIDFSSLSLPDSIINLKESHFINLNLPTIEDINFENDINLIENELFDLDSQPVSSGSQNTYEGLGMFSSLYEYVNNKLNK